MTKMPSHESYPSVDELLRAAEAGGSGGERLSRSADRAGARYAAVMAALMALYLLVVAYVYPQEILWLDIAVTAVFVSGMAVTCVRYGRRRRASSLGWSRRYSVGSALSAGLFGLGMALLVLTDSRDAWLWVPYAVVTGLPLLVAGLMRGAR